MTANSDFSDGLARCGWVDTSPEYIAYHDTEWGFPQGDDRALFEQLCLEGFQSGLSWRTILNKREAFRRGFAGFDPAKVARFDETRIQALLADAGIVRHRGKIEAVINNAGRALEMIEREGSLGAFLWRFEAPPGGRRPRAVHRPRRNPRPCPRRSRSWAGNSSGRPPCTRSCSRWAWSTTTIPIAIATVRANGPARHSGGRPRGAGPGLGPAAWRPPEAPPPRSLS